ncbi:MAG TPA: GtrA family protein [candidate division Zixibacteria bacterium]|nr:GtrA family protein [candidate division Zixibacteria bacterium]
MKNADTTRVMLIRWLKFNLVGGIGILLQLALLTVLSKLLHVSYLVATAVAVELTVLHNFVWHERYTWKSISACGAHPLFSRLIRFHLGNGAVSIIGNLVLMKLFAGELHIPVLVANMIAITICSLVNFCLADRWVFGAEL